MLAIVAAVLFGLALLLDLLNINLGAGITLDTLLYAGLTLLALHLAGVGSWSRARSGWARRR